MSTEYLVENTYRILNHLIVEKVDHSYLMVELKKINFDKLVLIYFVDIHRTCTEYVLNESLTESRTA